MKTTKKESTKSFSESTREMNAMNNNAFFGFANKGILPLQSLNSNYVNPLFGYHNPAAQWSYGIPPFSSPYFGIQPFTSPFVSSFMHPSAQMNMMNNNMMNSPIMPNNFTQQNNANNPAFLGAHEVSTTVNIAEDDDDYTIEITVPGYKNEDCKVKVKDSVLYVYGRRELENETAFYSLKENRNTFFERTFLLSNEVDTESIEANCVDGILTIILPKRASDSFVEKEIEITEEALA